jgi:hypothetical protein
MDNLRRSFPDKSEAELNRICRGTYANLSEQIINTISQSGVSEKALLHRMVITNAEPTRKAIGGALEFCRANHVALPDHLIPNEWGGPQDTSYENFRDYLYALYESIPCGVTETFLHPALECDELKAAVGTWQHRVWEHRIMADPMTRQHIEAHGIRLISYRELASMQK